MGWQLDVHFHLPLITMSKPVCFHFVTYINASRLLHNCVCGGSKDKNEQCCRRKSTIT